MSYCIDSEPFPCNTQEPSLEVLTKLNDLANAELAEFEEQAGSALKEQDALVAEVNASLGEDSETSPTIYRNKFDPSGSQRSTEEGGTSLVPASETAVATEFAAAKPTICANCMHCVADEKYLKRGDIHDAYKFAKCDGVVTGTKEIIPDYTTGEKVTVYIFDKKYYPLDHSANYPYTSVLNINKKGNCPLYKEKVLEVPPEEAKEPITLDVLIYEDPTKKTMLVVPTKEEFKQPKRGLIQRCLTVLSRK